MASTNKTANLELNQWVATDPVLMADFNADNSKIDAAVTALQTGALRIATGSYTGTGEYGTDHPNTLNVGFAPKLVFINGYASHNIQCCQGWFLRPSTRATTISIEMADHGPGLQAVTWTDTGMTWYCVGGGVTRNGNNTPASAYLQLNSADKEYFYVAIG